MKTMMALAIGLALAAAQAERKPNPEFEQLKKLEGAWESTEKDGAKVTYKVASNGSALLETMLHPKASEMLTVYHLDGAELVLTHYCSLGNQPHMKAQKDAKPGTLRFACGGGANVKCDVDMHMHGVVLTFVDADHLKQEWTMVEGGKEKMIVQINLVRAK